MSAKAKKPDQIIRLWIICVSPPNPDQFGAVLGLQDNSTTQEWVLHPGKAERNGDLRFECECRVRCYDGPGVPNFLGPFVHGPKGDRFLYLSWRPKEWRPGGPEVLPSVWLRRMKVRLGSITWKQIDKAVRSGVLETKVAGTGPSGPFGEVGLGGQGWTWRDS